MAHPSLLFANSWTLADLLKRFGDIPPHRIRLFPAPGTATEQDVLKIQARTDRLCELVEGVLVEKTMGVRESGLAMMLGWFLIDFVEKKDLGMVTGPDGTLRLLPGLVRIPDVAFISWERLPQRTFPDEPIPDLTPDLAIEILSKDNTRGEMQRKLKEYFLAGTRLVWYVDPVKRTVRVYTAPDQSTLLRQGESLDGGEVLPGFTLALERLFARLSPPRGSGRKVQKPNGKGK